MEYSFGVLAYNHNSCILETLESILYQIEKYGMGVDVDLLITDDCSKDNTVEIIQEWIQVNKGVFRNIITRYNTDNVGTVKNFNWIIDNIITDKFKIIAGDDVFASSNIFEKIDRTKDMNLSTYIRLDLNNDRIVFNQTAVDRFFYNKLYKNSNNKQRIKAFRYGGYFHTPSTLFDKRLYYSSSCSSFNRRFRIFEDDPTWYTMLRSNDKIDVTFYSSCIILYRISSMSVSNVTDNSSPFSLEKRRLKVYYAKDAKGLERLFQLDEISNRCKYLRPSWYFRKINDIYVHLILMRQPEYCEFMEHSEKVIKNETLYYTEIKKRIKKKYNVKDNVDGT